MEVILFKDGLDPKYIYFESASAFDITDQKYSGFSQAILSYKKELELWKRSLDSWFFVLDWRRP